MTRSVSEWIGKTDDSPVPDRVRVRNFLKFGGICQECGVKIIGKRWVCDHRKAIINGGQNRESNLGPIHEACDKNAKTPADVAEKSAVYQKQRMNLGIRKAKRTIPGKRFNGDPIPARMR